MVPAVDHMADPHRPMAPTWAIHEAGEDDWPQIWPIIHDVITEQQTFAYDPAMSEDEAKRDWLLTAPARVVVAADGETGNAFAQGTHRAGHLQPRHVRRLRQAGPVTVQALPDEHVDQADCRVGDVDGDFARPGGGIRQLRRPQYLRRAEAGHLDCFHRSSFYASPGWLPGFPVPEITLPLPVPCRVGKIPGRYPGPRSGADPVTGLLYFAAGM